MMRELTIVASCVRALVDFAVSRGARRNTLLERSTIGAEELADPDNRVAFSKYVALSRAAAELCQDPAFSLHFGERVDVSEVSIACSLGGVTGIDQAIAQLNRYGSLGVEVEGVGRTGRWQLKRRSGQLWIVDGRRNPNEFPELTEAGFARMICSTRRTFGELRFFKEIHFTHPAPAYRAEYDRIFRVPVVFGSAENALRMDETILAGYRIRPSSRYANEVLRDHADMLLRKLESGKSTKEQVASLLTGMLEDRTANIETISRKLGVSRQTLFRKLKSEGVTFEEVLSDLRCSLANHYLGDGKASVKETAYLLGFSDPAAFSRAFKRWTGQPPAAKRAGLTP